MGLVLKVIPRGDSDLSKRTSWRGDDLYLTPIHSALLTWGFFGSHDPYQPGLAGDFGEDLCEVANDLVAERLRDKEQYVGAMMEGEPVCHLSVEGQRRADHYARKWDYHNRLPMIGGIKLTDFLIGMGMEMQAWGKTPLKAVY